MTRAALRLPAPARAVAVLAGVLLTGCMAAPAADVNLTGFSAGFKQGYTEGCDSAGAPRPRRDKSRYRKQPDYQQGWDDGYSACSRR